MDGHATEDSQERDGRKEAPAMGGGMEEEEKENRGGEREEEDGLSARYGGGEDSQSGGTRKNLDLRPKDPGTKHRT